MNTDGADDMLSPRRHMGWQTFLRYLLWLAPQAMIAVVVTHMVRNRLAGDARVFFAYLLFSFAKFVVRFGVYHWYGGNTVEYFIAYWSLAILDTIFVLAVVHELYILVFSPYEGLRLLAAILFRWSAAILILVAAVTAAVETGSDLSRLSAGILILDRSATIVQIGLLILLFVATSSLSLAWRRHLFGIASGLVLIISIELVSLAIATRYGLMFANTYGTVKGIAYLCGVLIWTVYLLRREAPNLFTAYNEDFHLQEWNAALLKLLSR